MLRLLESLEGITGPAISLYLPPELPASDIEDMLQGASGLKEIPPDLNGLIAGSDTGAVLFWGEQYRCLVLPPFPIDQQRVCSGHDVALLRSVLTRELTVALILLRLGDYAIGVFQGEERVSSKVGTGLVHSRHKKGGSSQRRFERHREKQIESFFNRVCVHVREQLELYAQQLDYVIYGGESNTLGTFRKQCQYLEKFEDRTLGLRLNIRRPRQPMLKTAIGEVWSSRFIEWVEGHE